MLPKTPPRTGQVGFLYAPPYRIQGISVAGEQTVVQIPELDRTRYAPININGKHPVGDSNPCYRDENPAS